MPQALNIASYSPSSSLIFLLFLNLAYLKGWKKYLVDHSALSPFWLVEMKEISCSRLCGKREGKKH